ncbi:fumarylacetoacetate hydrolase family protein [Rhodococcus sp. USK13]|uniref:fumarylacetoacetate hydrolase family protein n=1 Tax=Rhodococcus sp. USK13 TaxID=2806442 RepID=UPI001BCF2519|nr:fumarylacetoacetate hydrolase family protein [Rhodococcus sp. USK13]
MRLAQFSHKGGPRQLGAVDGDEIIAITQGGDPETALINLLSDAAQAKLDEDSVRKLDGYRYRYGEVSLHSPVTRPGKFLAFGLNYDDHHKESGMLRPEQPIVFNKQSTCVTGPFDPVIRPIASDQLDYEGELGIVIGRRCRHVPRSRAREVIGGYTVINDVSVRDWQLATPTMTLGKSWDTHGPIGPWISTPDEIADPHDLRIRTWVNKELRQDGNTRDLLFDLDDIIEHLSKVCTLEPGDVIATGTPAGVGWAMSPKQFLQAGDVVRIEISGLGAIENLIHDEANDDMTIE